jgi:hypothetical protein
MRWCDGESELMHRSRDLQVEPPCPQQGPMGACRVPVPGCRHADLLPVLEPPGAQHV